MLITDVGPEEFFPGRVPGRTYTPSVWLMQRRAAEERKMTHLGFKDFMNTAYKVAVKHREFTEFTEWLMEKSVWSKLCKLKSRQTRSVANSIRA